MGQEEPQQKTSKDLFPSLKILNKNSKNGISVTKWNLESDRADSSEIDPLASVRSGDDLEDDTNSKLSDFQHMGQLSSQN